MIDLRYLDQKVELYHVELRWLAYALNVYLKHLVMESGRRPLSPEEGLRIKPLGKLAKRLKRSSDNWQSPASKPRKIRLEYDELQLLCRLNAQLQAQQHERPQLVDALGKVQQKALNISQFFALQ
jgi:hypothetical protein